MTQPHLLLQRLDEIGQSLVQSGHALALIGLGSVGEELHRLDEYSDLDFFAIVETGYKRHYIENLEWLSALRPIVYHFRNSDDGIYPVQSQIALLRIETMNREARQER